MELTPSSRSVLSSCNRLAARAPCMTAPAGARRKEKGVVCILSGSEEKDVVQRRIRRRAAFSLLLASPALSVAFSAYGKSKTMNPYDEKRLLQQNKKIQEANRAPDDFPNFIREVALGAADPVSGGSGSSASLSGTGQGEGEEATAVGRSSSSKGVTMQHCGLALFLQRHRRIRWWQ